MNENGHKYFVAVNLLIKIFKQIELSDTEFVEKYDAFFNQCLEYVLSEMNDCECLTKTQVEEVKPELQNTITMALRTYAFHNEKYANKYNFVNKYHTKKPLSSTNIKVSAENDKHLITDEKII